MGLFEDVDRVCRDVIAPAALSTDADVVPRSHLDALAPTGLFGATLDPQVLDAAVRAAHERLAGACLSTWFVVAQHQMPLHLVAAAPEHLREPLLPLLTSGTTIAGIAFSHLRRWPHCPVEVEEVSGGWRFRGEAPWFTGWGINDVAVLAGATRAGRVVFALVPAEAQAALRPQQPMQTVAVSAARTVALVVDDLVVPDDGILAVADIDDWQRSDRARTANVSPSVLGVARAALDRLAGMPDDAARAAAARLSDRLTAVRTQAYRLRDEVDPNAELERRLDLRAQAVALCVQATSALVVARGGRAMLRGDDAQLLARWALFLTVQAQTPPLRTALLGRLTA
jgi:hypothetical protein